MITKIKNSFLVKCLSLVLACNILILSNVSATGKVTLNAGTPILLETISTMRSDMIHPGQSVDFMVKHDVIAEGKVVIAAGSVARGQVMRSAYAKGLGKAGYVEVQVSTIQSVDGQTIPLTGGNIYSQGEDKQNEAIILGVLICILFLTIKGTNAIVASGTQVSAMSAATMNISVE